MSNFPHHFTHDEKLEFILIALWRLERIMSTVPSGLAALQASEDSLEVAVSALGTAVGAAVAEITTLVGQLSNSEDPAVLAIASKLSNQVSQIQSATNSLTSAIPAPPSA